VRRPVVRRPWVDLRGWRSGRQLRLPASAAADSHRRQLEAGRVEMASHFWWYVARAGGLVAWAPGVASCTWGLLHALRTFGRKPSPAWMLSFHRYLGALAVTFVAVHVIAILADSYVQFSLVDVLIPFNAAWHPIAVAWGIVGMYLLLAIEITSLA